MTIYVDLPIFKKSATGRKSYAHMTADSLDELHQFAKDNGVKAHFFHRGSMYPHYDVTSEQVPGLITAGAVQISSKELVIKAKKLRSLA